MNVVILGGTRGMGKEVARQMAERGDRVFLLGRNQEALAKGAEDIAARSQGHQTSFTLCDLSKPETFAPALENAWSFLGGVDAIIVTAAQFATQEELERDAELSRQLLTTNLTNTILFCEEARKKLLRSGGGILCVFSSVAGDRGRKPIVIYGATKAGLSAYLEGLDHKFKDQGLHVLTVKPGFVKTSMTAGLKPPPFAGEAPDVARAVIRGIDRKTPVIYAPAPWKYIMGVLKRMPRFVMRRIQF